MRLNDLPYPEVARHLEAGAVALWPVGATEAHGPHLPLGTDVLIAHETCRRVAEVAPRVLGVQALILEPLAFTITEAAGPFAGTLSLPRAAVEGYVRAVVEAAAAHAFRAVVLVNGHLEPAHRFALRDVVRTLKATGRSVALADPCERRFVSRLPAEFQSGSCHAGSYETSLVLAARPDLVDEAKARSLPDAPVDLLAAMKDGAHTLRDMGATQAYVGFPRHASAAEGEQSFQILTEIVLQVLQETLSPSEMHP